ncbi:carbohydrate ABC transporter substrate-binding protein (CUT1 family) [Halanaerobium saccharolyticum]|uniref:Carbohydrate ABC transporter substrate-binding protein (CUT1 family) n=1 Tax=Halanaerobium saccharolyticum TaxID=43595 RepID=A0A4R7YKG3_9FIRM|nr:sugar ABC transporter substrate-binding protein [Halanaerobium saccharolyticum]RAK03947.1 carbohydrate ABC transporter substrate-binding protein (CUT1 family) [Halanaerobium saccharolyticum]TDV97105.1 carbohydrate ABC transporter substrate-binding protein (CUT1 family) [Halanaerobium saccharolyticum]TDX49037.1 carbohydrate ABC transporter substrate-binding protein (CUT1 family) [Halanaerobium saccharolyticum]
MFKSKRKVLIVSLLMVLFLGFSSLVGAKSITVLVEGGGPAHKVAESTAEEFEKISGYEVIIETAPYDGIYDKMRAEIASPTGAYDVATIDVLWIPFLYNGLLPLDDVLTEDMKNDFFPGLVEGGSINNNSYGIPVWTNSKLLLYRKDLFNNEEYKKEFNKEYGYELEVPKNWEEFRDVAKFFTKDLDNDGVTDLYGTAVIGGNHGDSVTGWLEHSLQAGAESLVIDDKGDIVINKEPYIEGLNFLNKIVNEDKSVPSGTLEMLIPQAANLFWDGKLAMTLTWGHFYVPSNDPEQSSIAGNVGVAPMISGDKGIGAIPGPWYQVVPESSNEKEIAKEYLRFLYERNNLYLEELGVAARESVFNAFKDKKGYEHLEPMMKTLNAEQTKNRPAIREWQRIESEALIPAVQYTLGGSKTVEESIEWANEQIENILK